MYLFISIFIFGLIMTITPGPNNLMLMASGLNFGVRRSLGHVVGIWAGNLIMLIAVAVGLGKLFTDYPIIHIILKIASCVFLLYLAWKFGTMHPKELHVKEKGKPMTFLQASFFQWVNPKVWMFIIGAIAIFSSDTIFFERVILIGSTLLFTMVISSFAWLLGGYYLERLLKTPRQHRIFNIAMGVILAVTIIPMFF